MSGSRLEGAGDTIWLRVTGETGFFIPCMLRSLIVDNCQALRCGCPAAFHVWHFSLFVYRSFSRESGCVSSRTALKATMDSAYWCALGLLIVILNTCLAHGHYHDHVAGTAGEIQYSREFLLLMRDHISTDRATVVNSIPNYLRTNPKKRSIRTNRK